MDWETAETAGTWKHASKDTGANWTQIGRPVVHLSLILRTAFFAVGLQTAPSALLQCCGMRPLPCLNTLGTIIINHLSQTKKSSFYHLEMKMSENVWKCLKAQSGNVCVFSLSLTAKPQILIPMNESDDDESHGLLYRTVV